MGHNEVVYGEDFYISYNPGTGQFFTADLFNKMAEAAGKKIRLKDGEETALVHDGMFYILEGDFRKEYLKLIEKGFKTCYDFYKAHKKFRSNWSNDVPIVWAHTTPPKRNGLETIVNNYTRTT